MGGRWERRPPSPRRLDRIRTRLRRSLADIDHLLGQPLGVREGAVVVWAGMRGAVTVAAAQTLPETTPQRSVLVLVAFLVAATSLLVQGADCCPWWCAASCARLPTAAPWTTNPRSRNVGRCSTS
jgi:hypothetical protein